MNMDKVPQAPPRERELLASGIAIGMSLASSSIGPTESSQAVSFQPVEPVMIAIGRSVVGPLWVPDGDIAEQAVAAARSAVETAGKRRPDLDEVVAQWQTAEQLLTDGERAELRPAFDRLIGHDSPASTGRSSARHGGGQ
jgi:hypothetical protein